MLREIRVWSVFVMVALAPGAFAKMIAYYPFEEGQGTVTADVTGNGNNGTLNSGVTWVPGVKGTAVHFDTAGERIVIGPIDPSGETNAMTLAAWINWQGRNHSIAQQGIIGKRLGWTTTGAMIKWFWQTNPAGDLLFRADYSGGGTSFGWGNALLVPHANEWTHVAVTWANGAAVQYINAERVSTGNVTFRESANATPVTIGCVDSTNNETFVGAIDEVRIYDTALAAAEIAQAMTGDTAPATAPQPPSGATDVPREVVLSWKPGEFAASHDVYFGTDFAAVDQASRTDDRGVLVSIGQTETSYDPQDVLDFGRVYYWRVDEVNAPPDSGIAKGPVWSFTVEPYTYPLTNVTATASSSAPGANPQNTVNGSGLDASDQHSTDMAHMWVSSGVGPNWIRYEFDASYKLYEMWVWNSNQMVEQFVGFGAKDVTVEYSVDGTNWVTLEGVPQFAQATGLATYTANTIVDFGGAMAKFVKLTINSNWGGVMPQTGLSEVRFYYAPVQARAPIPADGATGVALEAQLTWRPGREVISHKVFFGPDSQAVAERLVVGDVVAEPTYLPAAMNFGTKYYWMVDEIGQEGSYPGNLWSFTTQEFAVIDDFESYNDDNNRIYDAWIDGVTTQASGSTVGYMEAPFAERRIVHGGAQSMPLLYDNSASPFVSEAERTFDPVRNWTTNGAETLSLWIRGSMPAFLETASGTILMNAIGADIWGTSDAFRLAYKTLNGDGTIVARVESIANSNAWAKGGVMIRQSVDPGSVHAFMPITPGGSSGGNGASFQRRLTPGGDSTNSDNPGPVVAAPYWVKLERKGNAFSGFISPDGVTWTQLGTAQTIPMTGPVLIGLALCSHDAAVATGAEFSNVSMTGNVTGSWQVAEIGAPQPIGNSPESIYVTVKDSAGKSKTLMHPDVFASARPSWVQWKIPLSEFTSGGVNLTRIKSMVIGVGNRTSPVKGGTGTVYIDDIGFGRTVQ
ncbi:MAG TPA: discoidin domain-containing protein [Sedimentisphaerales bacterium]|nr:discoidin domain-containing protein [Sedimentisphaerales bacterium]